MYRNALIFTYQTFCSPTLWIWNSSQQFFCEVLGYSVYLILCHLGNSTVLCLFFNFRCLFFFFFLPFLLLNFNTVLNMGEDHPHLCFSSYKNKFQFFLIEDGLATVFVTYDLVMLSYIPLEPICWASFYKSNSILSNASFCIHWGDCMIFTSSFVNMRNTLIICDEASLNPSLE